LERPVPSRLFGSESALLVSTTEKDIAHGFYLRGAWNFQSGLITSISAFIFDGNGDSMLFETVKDKDFISMEIKYEFSH
tara:strand:- start:14288 stop:14524 length:237 start_codon:yes stop_codon:yes gene_type:complete